MQVAAKAAASIERVMALDHYRVCCTGTMVSNAQNPACMSATVLSQGNQARTLHQPKPVNHLLVAMV